MRIFSFLFVICFTCFLVGVSCSRPGDIGNPNGNDTTLNSSDTLKVDSLSTWSIFVTGRECTSFAPFRIDQQYKFRYDTAGNISAMTVYSSSHSNIPYIYSFRYDDQKRIETIASQKMPYDDHTYDTLSFYYPSNSDPYIFNYIFKVSHESTLVSYRAHQSGDTTTIVVTGTPSFGNSLTWFRANLISDTSGNVKSITYFRTYYFPPGDTAMTVNYTYYKTVPNPYYTVFKKLRSPLFFLLSFGDLYGNYSAVDLAQFVSKNCFSTAERKIYNNVSCVGTPGITTRLFEYDLSDYYTLNGGNVISIRDVAPEYYNTTFSGFVNAQAAFFYR